MTPVSNVTRGPLALAVAAVCLLALAPAVAVAADGAAGAQNHTARADDVADRGADGLATPAADGATTIAVGETLNGSVDQSDPTRDNPRGNGHEGTWRYDPVEFSGTAGEVVHLSMAAPVDTSLVLIGPHGDRVADNEDGGPGNNSELLVRLPRNGTYRLQATSHYPETTFDYVLTSHRHPEASEDVSSIDVGETRVGLVDRSDGRSNRTGRFSERVAVRGEAGQNVTLSVTAWVDSAVALIAPNGTVLDRVVAPSGGRDARLAAPLPESGTATAVVESGDGDGRFAYRLSAVPTAAASARPAVRDSHGTARLGSRIETVGATVDRPWTRVGEPVTARVTLANLGDDPGTVERTVAVGSESETASVRVAPASVEQVAVPIAASEPGRHEVTVDGATVGSVRVVDPAASDGNTAAVGNGSVIGFATDADGRATFDLDAASGAGPVAFTRLEAEVGGESVGFRAEQRSDAPSGLPAYGDDAAYLSLSGAGDASASASLSEAGPVTVRAAVDDGYSEDPAAVVLAQYDERTDSWVRAGARRVATTDSGAVYQATVTRPGAIAVGTVDDPVERTVRVANGSRAGDRSMSVRLANDGTATVERSLSVTATDTANGSTRSVTDLTVTLAPGEVRRVPVSLSSLDAGTHRLAVDGEPVGSVTIDAAADDQQSDSGSRGALAVVATLLTAGVIGAVLARRRR